MSVAPLEAAHARALAGAYIVAIWWTDGLGVCACPKGIACASPGKHPLTPRGLDDASCDPEVVERWRVRWPDANAAERTDEVVRIDIDLPDVAEALASDIPLQAETELVRTPTRGGLHIALRTHGGVTGRTLFLKDRRKLGELKAARGYVLVPPSRIGQGCYELVSAPGVGPQEVDDPLAWLRGILPCFGVDLADDTDVPRREYELLRGAIYEGHGRHNALVSYAGKVWIEGMGPEALAGVLQAVNQAQCYPPLPGTEIEQIAVHFIERREPRPVGGALIASGGELPEIIITGLHLREKAAAGWRALVADNDPPRFFRHGAYVAHVVNEDGARPRIAHLNIAGLRGRLDRCANWTKVGRMGLQPTSPPKEVVEDMLELPEQLPPLRGIVGIPTYARDGTLATTPGYQSATRLYYAPAGDPVPSVPECPDATDLKRAKQIIGQEWLADFPFVDDASRANAIAAPLTAVARELIDGPTPLFATDAPAQGTGKSLLANGIGTIISGTQPAVTTETRSEEELRKRITALLRGGAPVVLLDNITKRLESGTLCSLLTAPTWSDRLLSKNETIDVPVRAVWIATGNNLELSGEMTRRVVWIRLDARVDRPWERSQFRHPQLHAWVVRHRHELAWAFLVLVQHWIAEGRPEWQGRVLGSFESWSLIVGGVLEAAGIAGFMENREQLYRRMDAETEEWRALVAAWWDEHGPKPVKASALFPLASELAPGIFAKARDDAKEQVLKATLGRAIAARRDRRYGDLFIRSAHDDGHAKVAMWRLEHAAPEPDLAGVESEDGRTPAEPPHEFGSVPDSFAGDAGNCGGDSAITTEFGAQGGACADLETGAIQPPQPPQPPQSDSQEPQNGAGDVRETELAADEPPQPAPGAVCAICKWRAAKSLTSLRTPVCPMHRAEQERLEERFGTRAVPR